MAVRFSVRLTAQAESDLEEIIDFVAQHAPQGALSLLAELRALAASQREFPNRGNVPKELETLGRNEFRQLIRKPYRMFYRVDGKDVVVLMIADGRRDMEELLQQRLLGL